MLRRCAVIVVVLCIAIGLPAAQVPQAQSAPLRIIVVSGEDAVNIIQQRTAVAPIVEVRDRNDQPVAGAMVTFTIQGGRATFAGAQTLSVTTNAIGQAAVTGLTPTTAGAVQINVAAAFQGQTAAAAITQTNFATAAQAASAGSSASSGAATGAGGGGGIGAGTITAVTLGAVGVAGGYIGYQKYQEHVEGEPPVVDNVTVIPAAGLQGATPISLAGWNATWHGEGATLTADWGDGSVSTISTDAGLVGVTHVYQAAGTFTVRVTLTDAWERSSTAQTSVTIKSLTGRWNVGACNVLPCTFPPTGSFFTLTQSGGSVAGTYTAASGPGSGTVTGTVRAQTLGETSPNILLSVTPTSGGLPSTYMLNSGFNDGNTIGGTMSTGAASTNVSLVRQ